MRGNEGEVQRGESVSFVTLFLGMSPIVVVLGFITQSPLLKSTGYILFVTLGISGGLLGLAYIGGLIKSGDAKAGEVSYFSMAERVFNALFGGGIGTTTTQNAGSGGDRGLGREYLEALHSKESIDDFIDKLKLYRIEAKDTLVVLLVLGERMKKSPSAKVEAASKGILLHALGCIAGTLHRSELVAQVAEAATATLTNSTELASVGEGAEAEAEAEAEATSVKGGFDNDKVVPPKQSIITDHRISAALDVIVDLLHLPEAKVAALSDVTTRKEIVDLLVTSMQDFIDAGRRRNNTPFSSSNSSTGGMGATAMGMRGKGSGVEVDDEEQYVGPIGAGVEEEEVRLGAQLINSPAFLKICKKFVMVTGMLAQDTDFLQTLIGDRGGLDVLLACLKDASCVSPDIVKWCCFSLIHLCLEHPPNKREFVLKNGIPRVIDALKLIPDQMDLHQQAFMLLFIILAHDPHSKVNLASARQAALTNGLFDVIQASQKNFKTAEDIQLSTKSILDLLIADWS